MFTTKISVLCVSILVPPGREFRISVASAECLLGVRLHRVCPISCIEHSSPNSFPPLLSSKKTDPLVHMGGPGTTTQFPVCSFILHPEAGQLLIPYLSPGHPRRLSHWLNPEGGSLTSTTSAESLYQPVGFLDDASVE